jgi:3-phytase
MNKRICAAWRILAVVATLLMPLAPAVPGRAAFRPDGQLSLSSTTGSPGDVIRVSAGDLPAGLSGSVLWGEQQSLIAMAKAGSYGQLITIVSVPDVAPGKYTLRTVFGTSVASTQFTVIERRAASYRLAPNPDDSPTAETSTETPVEPPPTEAIAPTDIPAASEQADPTDTEVPIAVAPSATEGNAPTEAAQVDDQPTTDATSAATQPSSQDLPFPPVADSYALFDNPDQTFGTEPTLISDASPEQEAFLRFQVTGIGSVAMAKLRLFVTNGTGSPVEVYGVSGTWDEGSLTWSTRPPRITDRVGEIASAPEQSWVDIDVSALVQGDGQFDIVIVNPHSDGFGFASRESANPPELVVTAGQPTKPPAQATPTSSADSTIEITSPETGTTLAKPQELAIEAAVSGPIDATLVEFLDNGELVGSDDSAPFSYQWIVDEEQSGKHSWTAVAHDAAGVTIVSAPVMLTVEIGSFSAAATGGRAKAARETAPVPHGGDAADDPAIWIHPTDPALSTIIGTDKLGGLAVYDLSGAQLYYYSGSAPNNVDLRYNMPLSGTPTSIVVTSDTTKDAIRIYRVDPSTRGLQYVAARTIYPEIGVAGLCLYVSPTTGKYYAFVSDSSGNIQQWELYDNGSGRIDARQVRSITLSSVTEGMVADDGTGALYVSQENVGIWRYGAEPGSGSTRSKVDGVGTHLTADIEGLAIYYGGPGYLIASSQGSDDYAVYRRDSNEYVGRFSVVSGTIDGTDHTDGLDVTNFGLNGTFSTGMFVAQDNTNSGTRQNFKLVPWSSVANSFPTPLEIDTGYDPRLIGPDSEPLPARAPLTFYVDSIDGSDANAGTSNETAWRSLSKLNSTYFLPGDRILFRRGGVWNGKLSLGESGISGQTILIGAFGAGDAPLIQGGSSCVSLAGSYIVVQDLHVHDCDWAGIDIGGSRNVVRRNVITGNVAGVFVSSGANSNRVTSNIIRDNNKMQVNTAGGSDDNGAFGVLLRGDKTDVSYNSIRGSNAFSYDYGRDGAAVEVYGAQWSNVHHNLAINNDAFAELGNARSADNTFAYNVVRSVLATSTFVVTRGAEASRGSVKRTRLYNNTVFMTGASSQGFVCSSGCTPDILIMRNNIIQAVLKVGYADGRFDEDRNIYYGGIAQFTKGANSRIMNPRFVDPFNDNFALRSSSWAIDRGVDLGYGADYAGNSVPIDGNQDGTRQPDLGAYEYSPG